MTLLSLLYCIFASACAWAIMDEIDAFEDVKNYNESAKTWFRKATMWMVYYLTFVLFAIIAPPVVLYKFTYIATKKLLQEN